jgi:hypothetical protein
MGGEGFFLLHQFGGNAKTLTYNGSVVYLDHDDVMKRVEKGRELNFEDFFNCPLVERMMFIEDREALEHLHRLQFDGRNLTLGGIGWWNIVAFHFDYPLRLGRFLLPYVIGPDITWLWHRSTELASEWKWWYTLFQHGFYPTCSFLEQSSQAAWDKGRLVWRKQRASILAVFVCVKRQSGSRDMARLIATVVRYDDWSAAPSAGGDDGETKHPRFGP